MSSTITPYYNTAHESCRQLAESQRTALSQEAVILRFMLQHQGQCFTPFDIQRRLMPTVPITSIRRAMTNLTIKGDLEQTHNMKQGEYGKPNHTWRARNIKAMQLKLF